MKSASKTSLAAALLGGLLFAVPASAQDGGGFADRLGRLEAGAAALGAPIEVAESFEVAQAGSAIPPSLAADFEIRLQRLERTLSELTGKYEESTYQLSQLKDRLERMNGDIDFRLQQLEGGKGGSSAAAAAPAAADNRPADRPADRPTDRQVAQTQSLPANADPVKQYEHAFELLRESDYAKAEAAFTQFLAKNKGHTYAANAQYWLGETYYVRDKYAEAAVAFAEAFQKYPKSSKAPDSLLKLGMSLAKLNKKQEACTAYGQLLAKFPEAAASVKRRADQERRKLSCPG
ncbi:tol-pal system protein YbgF [Azospirillum sp. A39]|uniref:tol-pal system protein YbgF n=1 Tax=Azospirillum sp. A39 TaxID=3462279 RepID=UPI00404678D9